MPTPPALPEITRWRHDLHAMPELGLEETQTAAYVADCLRKFGLKVTEGVGQTGVVASLHGALGPGRAIGLRAEFDALPMSEPHSFAYRSRNAGRMHACGHDGHMAMLLGAAQALALAGTDFTGTIHFIFQPAEEGLGGALAMLADGLFERFPCDEIYAVHNFSSPLGQVVVHHGVVAAAADIFHIDIIGLGGHAATPHATRHHKPATRGGQAFVGARRAARTHHRRPPSIGSDCGGHERRRSIQRDS